MRRFIPARSVAAQAFPLGSVCRSHIECKDRNLNFFPLARSLTSRRGGASPEGNACGFSFVETLVALGILLVVAAMALLPAQRLLAGYALSNDARNLAAQLALARMRAAANFTQIRVVVDPLTGTYHMETYDRTAQSFVRVSPDYALSEGNAFSAGSVTTPAGEQQALQLSTAVTFNSRGMPVDAMGAPTGNTAFYLTDNRGDYWAVTVSAAGGISLWDYDGQKWVPQS